MNTSFHTVDELLNHVTENTNEIIDSISENDIDNLEGLENFLAVLIDKGLLRIVGQDDDGNDLYQAI